MPSPDRRKDEHDNDDYLGDIERRILVEVSVTEDEVPVDLIWLHHQSATEHCRMAAQTLRAGDVRLRSYLQNEP